MSQHTHVTNNAVTEILTIVPTCMYTTADMQKQVISVKFTFQLYVSTLLFKLRMVTLHVAFTCKSTFH